MSNKLITKNINNLSCKYERYYPHMALLAIALIFVCMSGDAWAAGGMTEGFKTLGDEALSIYKGGLAKAVVVVGCFAAMGFAIMNQFKPIFFWGGAGLLSFYGVSLAVIDKWFATA